MSDTAPAASSLLKKMRSSFGQKVGVSPSVQSTSSLNPAVEQVEPITTTDKLDTLDKILNEVEPQQTLDTRQQNVGIVAQAAPTAVDQVMYQQQVQLAQASGAKNTKESFAATTASTTTEAASNAPVVEAATGMQFIDQEPAPEIPPEVSEYLAHVENHANQQPQEIVVGEAQQNVPLATHYPKQSVLVLPITPDTEKIGKTKGPLESIRWLVEWSYKMMKEFSGRIIYREVET